MTNIDTWSPWVAIFALAAPILLAYVGAAYSLYLSHRHLGAIKEALKNSRYIYIWGPSLGNRGLIWSLFEISKISGMIVWPRSAIMIGELDPVDLKNFPPHLKRHLIANLTIMSISLIWGIVSVALVKY
ncbi:hypothetical protein [Pseudomonas fluorescens]|uniref:hypothetical protein n=1 Tax=Pseudomonas fluorescens TaxID=294 RepID=UPI0004D0DDA0|nr:hypothetical protein [Pseudomonas fluorescens]AIG04158.1 hypothetical protein HZ99_18950 [Pseudomonas fluorescens]